MPELNLRRPILASAPVADPHASRAGALIGYRRNGRPIHLYAGGSGTGDAGGDGGDGTGDGGDGGGDAGGGEDGKKSGTGPATKPLAEMSAEERADYWKRQSRKHEQRLKGAEVQPGELEQLREAAAELEKIRENGRTELERAAGRAEKAEAALVRVGPELARLRAALTHGLGEELATRVQAAARRLVGATDAELAADAADYFAAAPITGQRPQQGFDQGVRQQQKPARSVEAGRDLWRARHPTKT